MVQDQLIYACIVSKTGYNSKEKITSRNNSIGGSLEDPAASEEQRQRLIKIHEELLVKISKNRLIFKAETEKFYT